MKAMANEPQSETPFCVLHMQGHDELSVHHPQHCINPDDTMGFKGALVDCGFHM